MILAGGTTSQSYLAQGYQKQTTGINYTLPNPPTTTTTWAKESISGSATWTEETRTVSP